MTETDPVGAARALFAELDQLGATAPDGGTFDRRALDLIAAAGLRGIAVPGEVGGVDLPLVQAVDVWSELARADGSIGWCAFASDSAAAYFGAYLPDEGAHEIFGVNELVAIIVEDELAGEITDPTLKPRPQAHAWAV